jgi:hypothetical protein
MKVNGDGDEWAAQMQLSGRSCGWLIGWPRADDERDAMCMWLMPTQLHQRVAVRLAIAAAWLQSECTES